MKALFRDQAEHQVAAPEGFVIVGVPSKRPPRKPGQTRFQLRDGREIEIDSQDVKKVFDVALSFIWGEKFYGRPYAADFDGTIEGVPVRYAGPFQSDPLAIWPTARPKSTRNYLSWSLTGLLALTATLLYAIPRALAWIIEGFADR